MEHRNPLKARMKITTNKDQFWLLFEPSTGSGVNSIHILCCEGRYLIRNPRGDSLSPGVARAMRERKAVAETVSIYYGAIPASITKSRWNTRWISDLVERGP
jgi:hypothetical protein